MNDTALSTTIVTPFAFRLWASEQQAIAAAQHIADQNACPCSVWRRDGWYTVCEIAPELIEPDPGLHGWCLWAVVDPSDARTS